jgi:hypothetical protein
VIQTRIAIMTINFNYSGRMISGSKRSPKGHVCVFNANLCTKEHGKFWFGDIDLTDDRKDLERIAAEKGCDIYVLREMDARFSNEASPKFENAIAVISPTGEIRIEVAA